MSTMRVGKDSVALTVLLRRTEQSLMERVLECPVDLDQHGDVLGIEVEAPRQAFGAKWLDGLEWIDLAKDIQKSAANTPKGRQISAHAQERLRLEKRSVPWISYDSSCDMMYIGVSQDPKRTYEISVPVDCRFFLDKAGCLYRIEIPLDEVRKNRAIYL